MRQIISYEPPYPPGTPVAPGAENAPCCPESVQAGIVPMLCTREINHPGRHEAWGTGGRVYVAWTDNLTDDVGGA